MRKILFTRDSLTLQPLRDMIEKQTHKALVLWALDCARTNYLRNFEQFHTGDSRPREALDTAEQWARGYVKMPVAKKAIHAAHEAAAAVGDANPLDAGIMAAGRAIGHAAATVHVETHAMGVVMYGLTSAHYLSMPDGYELAAMEELRWLTDRLRYWQKAAAEDQGSWAEFLQNETMPNKEALLRKKLDAKVLLSREDDDEEW